MLLTLAQVAERLGRSRRSLRYQIRVGELPAIKQDGRWFIDEQRLTLSPGQRRAEQHRIDQAHTLMRMHRYVMHLDIRRYFPSIDLEILRGLLAPRLRDGRVVRLLDVLIESGAEFYAHPEVRGLYTPLLVGDGSRLVGVPIGTMTSQWWGNLYLDGLDHFIKRTLKVPGYVRYLDDSALFTDDRALLRRWKREVQAWLLEERRLLLHPGKGHIRSTELPQRWLGMRITRGGMDPEREVWRRFRQDLPRLLRGSRSRLKRSVAAWRGALQLKPGPVSSR